MPWKKWIVHFLVMSAALFLVFAAVQYGKGVALGRALGFGAFWGPLTAAIFLLTRIHYFRRKIHCAVCNDLPHKESGS